MTRGSALTVPGLAAAIAPAFDSAFFATPFNA